MLLGGVAELVAEPAGSEYIPAQTEATGVFGHTPEYVSRRLPMVQSESCKPTATPPHAAAAQGPVEHHPRGGLIAAEPPGVRDRGELADRLQADRRAHLEYARGLIGPSLRGKTRASDIVQSAYAEALRAADQFRDDSGDSFRAWIRRILHSKVRSRSRYLAAEKRAEPSAMFTVAVDPLSEVTPSSVAIRRENTERLCEALSGMSADYRTILLLRVVEGRSHEEIAQIMNRPIGSTRMLLSRARAKLSLALEGLDQP